MTDKRKIAMAADDRPLAKHKAKRRAFTMIELMVVITIIGLLAAIVVPSIISIFTAGADNQAYGLLTGQLAAARSLAMNSSSYTCVHIQQCPSGTNKGKYYSAVLIRSPFTNNFFNDHVFYIGKVQNISINLVKKKATITESAPVRWTKDQWSGLSVRFLSGAANGAVSQIITENASGNSFVMNDLNGSAKPSAGCSYMIFRPVNLEPVLLPGNTAFGRIMAPFVSNGKYMAGALGNDGDSADNTKKILSFTTVNIIFSPDGRVVTGVNNGGPTGSSSATGAGIVFDVLDSTQTVDLQGLFYPDPVKFKSIPIYDMKMKLWLNPDDNALPNDTDKYYPVGTTAVTIIDYSRYSKLVANSADPNVHSKVKYLEQDCQYLPLNVYTGQLLPRR